MPSSRWKNYSQLFLKSEIFLRTDGVLDFDWLEMKERLVFFLGYIHSELRGLFYWRAETVILASFFCGPIIIYKYLYLIASPLFL